MCMMYPIIKKCDCSNHRAAEIVRDKQAIELLCGLYSRAHRNETTDLQLPLYRVPLQLTLLVHSLKMSNVARISKGSRCYST